MGFFRDALLFLHFLGFAALFGGFLVQISTRPRRVVAAMLHGALTQLVTGLGLVGVNEALDESVDNTKIGVKLIVLLVITGLVWANRAKPAVPDGVFFAIGGLTTVNVAVAVF